MDKLLENAAGIIDAASQSNLAFASFVILGLAVLAVVFFRTSHDRIKLLAFASFLLLGVGALAAVYWPGGDPPDDQADTNGYRGPQLIRTANLGIQFVQDGQPVPLIPAETTVYNIDRFEITLKRSAFEIRVPETMWPSRDAEYPALQVAVSESPRILGMVRIGEDAQHTPFFAPGTGLASWEHGSGGLDTAGDLSEPFPGHNHIVGQRFNASGPGYRAVFVSAIEKLDEDRNLLAEGISTFMVFYMNVAPDRDDDPTKYEDVIKRQEVELVEIRFSG